MSALASGTRLPCRALMLWVALSACGCTDDSDVPSAVVDAAGPVGPDSGDAGADARAQPMDAQLEARDAELDTGLEHDGALVAPEDGSAPADASPRGDAGLSVLSASARQVGRFGSDLSLTVEASAAGHAIIVLRVELLGPQQAPRGSVRELPLVTPIDAAEGTAQVVLAGVFESYGDLSSVRIAVVDDGAARSLPVELAITRQPVVELGASCDASLQSNRCGSGLGCKGPAPTTCMSGEAPTITRAGYFVDRLGARILIEGSDPDADAMGYSLHFLDSAGEPVAVQLNGDDSTPGSTEFTGTIEQREGNGFFVAITPTSELTDRVTSIELRVFDQADHVSAPALTVMRAAAPDRGPDASCDPRGFHLCPEGSLCSGSGDQGRCRALDDARVSACESALVLTPGSSPSRVRGSLGASLWDPPLGCSFSNQTGNADRVVKLVLSSAVDRLVLSTDSAYTGFDSELYLLDSCTAAPSISWCVADQAGGDPKAILTLTNLPAGEYYVVVESFPSVDRISNTFALSATLQ